MGQAQELRRNAEYYHNWADELEWTAREAHLASVKIRLIRAAVEYRRIAKILEEFREILDAKEGADNGAGIADSGSGDRAGEFLNAHQGVHREPV